MECRVQSLEKFRIGLEMKDSVLTVCSLLEQENMGKDHTRHCHMGCWLYHDASQKKCFRKCLNFVVIYRTLKSIY